jgi:broad specificity phosphatase PhoE
MRVYFIRHGQSTNNVLADVSQRVYDPPLTDLGQRQAHALAEYLVAAPEMPLGMFALEKDNADNFGFTHLYTSAMTRALQTTAPIAKALNIMPEIWVDIHEAGGVFLKDEDGKETGYPGITRAQLAADFPNYHIPDTVTDHGWWDVRRGEETEDDFMLRVVRVAQQLQRRANQTEVHGNDRIALVSHGLFLSALLKVLMGHPIWKPTSPFFAHYNTAITRLDFNEGWDDPLRLHYLNRVEHLPLEMRSW